MHAVSLHFMIFSVAFSNLVNLAYASGINCYGHGCGWDCPGHNSCSEAFAATINGLADDKVLMDGQELACIPDAMGSDGLCAFIHGLGNDSTTGANMKLVAQDLANHCGECGQAPIHRDNGNKLEGGWYQIERTKSEDICSTPHAALGLCDGL